MKKLNLSALLLIFVLLFTTACESIVITEKTDDWEYSGEPDEVDYSGPSSYRMSPTAMPSTGGVAMMESSPGMGFSVGGAKDVDNFRENIENDYLPLPTDLTYEGLFYDYYFDTDQQDECKKLFCPSYSYAISEDPFSGDDDYYLSVGLNSNLKESDFERKKLNLMVVLDISGSMSSPFDEYYYDENPEFAEEDWETSKMEVANEAVVGLLNHLNDDDRFGMVLFDNQSYIGKPISDVADTDMDKIAGHILEIVPMGGTHMESGMEMGSEMFEEFLDSDPAEYENRIIFLTDAMPNIGETDEDSLLGMLEANADDNLYTTFIGIGVDFSTELIEAITKVRGANYYSVHSSSEFLSRMDDEFEYMVTPLVFNLELKLEADGYEIEKVYGSPEADEATGELMNVNTLFPSKTEGGETRGGLVLLKLKKTSESGSLKLMTSYEDREGNEDSDVARITFGDERADFYENDGIQKGILLARYADLLKNWMTDERAPYNIDRPFDFREPETVYEPAVTFERGIIVPPPFPPMPIPLGEWERQSLDLEVSKHYGELFEDFRKYFKSEMNKIDDESLERELETLDRLLKSV